MFIGNKPFCLNNFIPNKQMISAKKRTYKHRYIYIDKTNSYITLINRATLLHCFILFQLYTLLYIIIIFHIKCLNYVYNHSIITLRILVTWYLCSVWLYCESIPTWSIIECCGVYLTKYQRCKSVNTPLLRSLYSNARFYIVLNRFKRFPTCVRYAALRLCPVYLCLVWSWDVCGVV